MSGRALNKVIKTESEYAAALERLDALMDLDPAGGTEEADQLELLALLIQDYETRTVPAFPLNAVDAIRFRMEQANLTPRDLIPIIGSRSKVSEVLSGKRPLTVSMIRALNAGLGVPLNSLLQEEDELNGGPQFKPSEFPIRELVKRGWIAASDVQRDASMALEQFLAPLKGSPAPVLFRKSNHVRAVRAVDKAALLAWSARILQLAESTPANYYAKESVTPDTLKEVVALSVYDDAPNRVREFLSSIGIVLVVQPHLPKTHLDGAALISATGNPVIGLTIRYDRVDHFWFCLLHELAHVVLHLRLPGDSWFFDDLDVDDQGDPREREADALAGEILIPEAVWKNSPASGSLSPMAAEHLARKLQIHPAIVAGRMRHQFKAYRALNQLVGQGQVRKWFADIDWSGS